MKKRDTTDRERKEFSLNLKGRQISKEVLQTRNGVFIKTRGEKKKRRERERQRWFQCCRPDDRVHNCNVFTAQQLTDVTKISGNKMTVQQQEHNRLHQDLDMPYGFISLM